MGFQLVGYSNLIPKLGSSRVVYCIVDPALLLCLQEIKYVRNITSTDIDREQRANIDSRDMFKEEVGQIPENSLSNLAIWKS
jgi:hypothetical protein